MSSSAGAGARGEIPGGPTRKSRIADRGDLPALDARARVVAVLGAHDEPSAFDRLVDADRPMVGLLARESAAFGAEPAIRYSAIAALSHHPSAQELNLLTDLARFGEDGYVRGHALLALGATGSYAHLTVIASALNAEDSFERGAAAKSVAALARHASPEALQAHATAFGGPELAARIGELLSYSATDRPAAPRQTATAQKQDEQQGPARKRAEPRRPQRKQS